MYWTNDFLALLPLITRWLASPDGSNLAFALLCAAALVGLPTRFCLCLTLLLHLALALI